MVWVKNGHFAAIFLVSDEVIKNKAIQNRIFKHGQVPIRPLPVPANFHSNWKKTIGQDKLKEYMS